MQLAACGYSRAKSRAFCLTHMLAANDDAETPIVTRVMRKSLSD